MAQSADDLVARNLAARGGADKLAALASVRFTGELIFPGDFKLTYLETRQQAGGAVRIDAALQGLTLVQAYDGKEGWRINPFEGRKDAERMSADEARSVADTGSIEGPLLAARAEGSSVTYLGTEDVDGTKAYKLKVAQKDGDEFTYYLDPDSYLEIKMIEKRKLRGAEQENEYELGDYEAVGGVLFPYSIASGTKGSAPSQRQTVTISKAEANVSVEKAYFAMPAAPAAK